MSSSLRASSTSGLLLPCCAFLLLLHTVVYVTANDVVRFDAKPDSDNIYDILEDEQLFIVDKKVKLTPQRTLPATRNSSSLSSSSSPSELPNSSQFSSAKQSAAYGAAVVGGTSAPGPALTPAVHHTGYTSQHVGGAPVAGGVQLAEELYDDFLIFSQDREAVELAEERRREEEGELSRRVRRQIQPTTEGSGANDVNVELTTDVVWNDNFLVSSTAEFQALEASSEATLATLSTSLSQTVTITVTGFRQGSTVVLCTVSYPNGDVDRTGLALALIDLRDTNKITYENVAYNLTLTPTLEDGNADSTMLPAICFTCKSYQNCTGNMTAGYTCKATSEYYFPSGAEAGDRILEANSELTAVEETLPVGIPVADQSVSSVYVSVNGLLSFGDRYGSFNPRPLPRSNKVLLCGYWANMRLSSNDSASAVYSHLYQLTSTNTPEETAVLNQANNYVQLYGDQPTFSSKYVLVATYEDMPPDAGSSATSTTSTERVNFQLCVISDGERTFGMIIYLEGGMQWNSALNHPVVIGYLNQNLDIDINTPDTELGNTNLRGVWFFELGVLPEPSPAQKCRDWHYQNVIRGANYALIERVMPRCPCNFFVALFSNNLWVEYIQGDTICFISFPFFGQFGKRCCYQAPGRFLRSGPLAGGLLWHHPWLDAPNHSLEDEQPKTWCCEQSDQCDLFQQVRPVGSCQNRFIWIIAIGSGDPHINTLDGKTFGFNAIGEFSLLQTKAGSNVSFSAQSRTCQAISASGQPVQASVFCAFAVKGNASNTLQVELSLSKEEMVVYLDGQDLTLHFKDEGNNFQRVTDGLVLRRTNNTLRASFREGINMNFTIGFRLLTVEVGIEGGFAHPVEGLLGNMNSDPEDDYIFPNGTTLPGNTSERELLPYGKTWALTNATSVFKYAHGMNTSSYTNDTFEPIYLQEVNDTVRAAAEAVCGGAGDIGCIFDYIATGDASLAVGTKDANAQVTDNLNLAQNSVPTLEGPARVNVVIGNETSISLNATDVEDSAGPAYVIVGQPESAFSFDNVTGTATWTPASNETSKLEFVAQDSTGATSAALQIEIVQCSGCTGGQGTCNFDKIRPQTVVDPFFKFAVCDCQTYYSGDDCELDRDACTDDPCPSLTTCTDLSVADHKAQNGLGLGYNCSDCPIGYSLTTQTDGSVDCLDTDECAAAPPCNQTCTNVQGSFSCSCETGYRLNAASKSACDDIDECQENTNTCEQTCVNVVGAYTCACLPGFTVNASDPSACAKDAATDPCAGLANSCSYACQNDSGSAQCVCPSGYSLAADGTSCDDIDECAQRLCSQNCANSNGTFTCSCFLGFKLDDDKVSCDACTGQQYGDNCNSTCECRGRGTCDSVRGCLCVSGWSGVSCSVDVDECAANANACPDNQVCSNTNGSFACACPPGYNKVNGTECEDIDECLSPSLSNCPQTCANTNGSFVCSCRTGYTYSAANNTCMDVNECVVSTDRCSQNCVNFPGSANCECRMGFVLADDRKSCNKEVDPCAALTTTKNCSYGCEVDNGAPVCFCEKGYELQVNGVDCLDQDECGTTTTNSCSDKCDNIPGSYQCSCTADGFVLDSDLRTCKQCDEYHWGPGCSNDCNCSPLSTERCDSVTGCVCKAGFLGLTCEQDRDDCSSSPCQLNSDCVDTAGSFQCDCSAGFTAGSGSAPSCEDVNECDSNVCDQTCVNSIGSYVCSCSAGFTSVGNSCNDIDECTSNPCDQTCRNTVGGFACECFAGFLLNATTRNTCYAQTECSSGNACQKGCRVVNGVENCFCPSGFNVNPTNSSACDDIDECATTTPCVNGSCTNFDGGFNCSCSPGTVLLNDGFTCQACSSGTYGADCAQSCTCFAANTEQCDAVNGTCTCKSGWNGDAGDCSANIDECSAGTPCSAMANSTCRDTNGSYVCDCNSGFYLANTQCVACDDTHYGPQCQSLCSCSRANTQNCDDVTGVCTCKATWSGDNCTVDVNECAANPTICQTDVMEVCNNNDGGYNCDCVPGYARPSPDLNCTDIDECKVVSLNTCNLTIQNCINYAGRFDCVCKTGYDNATTGTCENVDECLVSTANACTDRQACLDNVGSYTCVCKSGYTLVGSDCADIDECAQPSTNNCSTSLETCNNNVGSYTCDCNAGYTRASSSGTCTSEYTNSTMQFSLVMNASASIGDTMSDYYINLATEIRSKLLIFFRNIIGNPVHDIIINSLTAGSVVVNADLQINNNLTSNPEGVAAKGIENLLETGRLDVNGIATPFTNFSLNGSPLGQSNAVCDSFNILKTCPSQQECKDVSGTPSCSPVAEDDNLELVIGLGVGIPLFFILCILLALLIYFCCCRRKKDDAASTRGPAPSEDHRFPSIFAGQLATKGTWDAAHRHPMYSPDHMSVSHGSDSSGDGQLLKGRRQGRSDFQDSPWYENRGAVSAGAPSPRRPPTEDRDTATEGATSNFSWEYMFRLLAPYRGGFEIQRPNVEPTPNPAYSPRSGPGGARPDSMA